MAARFPFLPPPALRPWPAQCGMLPPAVSISVPRRQYHSGSMLAPPVSALILPSHFVTWIDPPAVCNVITLAHPMFRFPPPDLSLSHGLRQIPAGYFHRQSRPPQSFPTLPISIFPAAARDRDEAGNAVQVEFRHRPSSLRRAQTNSSPHHRRRLRFAAVPAAFFCRHFYIKINRAMVRSFTVRLQAPPFRRSCKW